MQNQKPNAGKIHPPPPPNLPGFIHYPNGTKMPGNFLLDFIEIAFIVCPNKNLGPRGFSFIFQ